tara:strand:+ start:113 stop:643 length:531 start_codon:yes stop_codon:yes gene_type:complete
MASILLPPAVSAVGALGEALIIATASIPTGIGYGNSMINITDPFGRANASITAILTAITPAKPMGPPALLTIPNCLAVINEIELISGYINSAQVQSIAGPPTPAGAPTPSPLFLAPTLPPLPSSNPILSASTNPNRNYLIQQPLFNPIGSPWFVVQQINELIKFVKKYFVEPQRSN